LPVDFQSSQAEETAVKMKIVTTTWIDGDPVDVGARPLEGSVEDGIEALQNIAASGSLNVDSAAYLCTESGARLATLQIFRPGRDEQGRPWRIDRHSLVEL
jgi:hypothetical protein